ncbi:MAG: ABC transporter permease subunit [Lachnospiraceae bacterium]|nr:ABC transporter permease subunit [Lachnospiraceae bacterium]
MQAKERNVVRYAGYVLFTVLGFLAAILINWLFPQMDKTVTFQSYQTIFGKMDAGTLLRIVLVILVIGFTVSGALAFRDEEKRKKYIDRAKFRFAMGILIAVLDITGTKMKILPQPFFPGPAEILAPFLEEGDFILTNTLYSLRLYIFGFSFGVLFGIGTGILIGWFEKAYYWISPVLNIAGVIPAVAWMPFALTLFPTPFTAAVFLIVICAWFPIASLTAMGIQSTPRAQYEAAKILGGNTAYLLFHEAIPNAMPQIFTGISTANANAFTTLVMAEMLGQPGGLGYYINLAKVWSSYYKVFAAILIMAVLFSIILKLVGRIEKYVLRWQRGIVK